MNAVRHILIWLVRGYRFMVSPVLSVLFGPVQGCRFTPTCSQYALEALERHGAYGGSILAVKRVCRCHPWSQCDHNDPVPATSAAPNINFKSGRAALLRGPNITAARQRRPTLIG